MSLEKYERPSLKDKIAAKEKEVLEAAKKAEAKAEEKVEKQPKKRKK